MGPLFLFSNFYFLPFFLFFLAFYCFIFSHFLFISSFLIFFLCFSWFFFHFFRRKSFFFSFCLYFFQICFLLALVSEFNCFLRSRCSMEMWCPNDIGRDSWEWVGPPAWWRACFNSTEWCGGSSPLKNEASPDCIIVVEWFYQAKRIIIVTWADFSIFFVDFVRKMCIFVSCPMKIVTFSLEKR